MYYGGGREVRGKPETPPVCRHGRRGWGQSRFGVMNTYTVDAFAPPPLQSPHRRRRRYNYSSCRLRPSSSSSRCGHRPQWWPRTGWTCRTPFWRAWWPSSRPSATGWWSWPFAGNADFAVTPTTTSCRWRSPTCWSVWWAYRAPFCLASDCLVTCTCACFPCRS